MNVAATTTVSQIIFPTIKTIYLFWNCSLFVDFSKSSHREVVLNIYFYNDNKI